MMSFSSLLRMQWIRWTLGSIWILNLIRGIPYMITTIQCRFFLIDMILKFIFFGLPVVACDGLLDQSWNFLFACLHVALIAGLFDTSCLIVIHGYISTCTSVRWFFWISVLLLYIFCICCSRKEIIVFRIIISCIIIVWHPFSIISHYCNWVNKIMVYAVVGVTVLKHWNELFI